MSWRLFGAQKATPDVKSFPVRGISHVPGIVVHTKVDSHSNQGNRVSPCWKMIAKQRLRHGHCRVVIGNVTGSFQMQERCIILNSGWGDTYLQWKDSTPCLKRKLRAYLTLKVHVTAVGAWEIK